LLWRSAGTEHRETRVKLAFFIDFDTGMPTGIGRYGIELLRALACLGEAPELWMHSSQKASWAALGLNSGRIRCVGPPGLLTLRTLPPVWSRLSGLDLVHFPGNVMLPVWSHTRRSTPIYDLGPFMFPWMKERSDTEIWKRRIAGSVAEADCLLAISGSTMDDLLELFPEARSRVHLTMPGVDHLLPGGSLERAPNPEGHILAVGIVEPRKNLENLILAYSILHGRGGLPPLVIAGHDGFRSEEIRSLPSRLGVDHKVRFTGYVPESQLRELFAGASCLVHAAIYEGFGFTVPEGFSMGLPVAASDRSSIRELFSKAAYMFDPGSPESIAEGISLCLGRGVLPEQLEERRKLFGSLTWENCALATLDAFRRTIGS
jgi:glycosyltransferase involved in cell wall biosynthesis